MFALLIPTIPASAENTEREWIALVRDCIRRRLETIAADQYIHAGDGVVYANRTLPGFYENRQFRPAWSGRSGPTLVVDSLLETLLTADREGLKSEDYHVKGVGAGLSSICSARNDGVLPDPQIAADCDIMLTDAFLIYGSHLVAGRVNPQTIDSEWFTKAREVNLLDLLDELTHDSTGTTVSSRIAGLAPSQSGYARLRTALANYRQIASSGGWPTIPEGTKMQSGDRGRRVATLRRRLAITGDLTASDNMTSDEFDSTLVMAVRHFQKRHGLDVDGVVGPKSLEALNVSADKRVRQISLNMERWRWLPLNLGRRYVLINIANFELDVVENEQVVLTMRVIVGRSYRRTPVFSDRISYIVLNPYWNVPTNLAVQDVVPQIKKNPNYLTEQKMSVYRGWGADARQIDPSTVDWTKISGQSLPFWFRQDPGPMNSLGRIKFMFPNQFNVYLHDTPKRELFSKTARDFSSGCIRVDKPLELAEYLLQGHAQSWNKAGLEQALAVAVDRTINLPETIPVHLLYWTAWVTPDGTVHFRNDIYGRDNPLDKELHEPPPMAVGTEGQLTR